MDEDTVTARAEQMCRQRRHHSFVTGHADCTICGAPNPDVARRARITLVADDLRAVYNSATESLLIEKRSHDSLGNEKWDVVEQMTAMQSRQLVADGAAGGRLSFYVFQLMTKGRTP